MTLDWRTRIHLNWRLVARTIQMIVAILVLAGIIYPILARLGFLPILFPEVLPEWHL